jgi:Tol biopolymer transport system component
VLLSLCSVRLRLLGALLVSALLAGLLPPSGAYAGHGEPATRPQTTLVNAGEQEGLPTPPPTLSVYDVSISADGRRVAFAADHVIGDTMRRRLFLYERDRGHAAGMVRLLELPLTEGEQPFGNLMSPAISGDGRYVAFVTNAFNLQGYTAPVGNQWQSRVAMRYDLQEGELIQLDVHSGEAPFEDKTEGAGFNEGVELMRPAISYDGSRVAFTSPEEPGLGSGTAYLWEEETGYARPAVTRPGGEYPGPWNVPQTLDLSPDGRWLVFESRGDLRVATSPEDGRVGEYGIWLQDLMRVGAEDAPILVNEPAELMGWDGNTYLEGHAFAPSVSDVPEGGTLPYVAFAAVEPHTAEAAEADEETEGGQHVYRWDGNSEDPRYLWLSPLLDTTELEPRSIATSMSADGSRVAFVSGSSHLVDDDTNELNDVFVATISGEGAVAVERISVTTEGSEGTAHSGDDAFGPYVSDDGSAVAFLSWAALVDGVDPLEDWSNDRYVYIRDLEEPEGEPRELTATLSGPETAQRRTPVDFGLTLADPWSDEEAGTEYRYSIDWGDGTPASTGPGSSGWTPAVVEHGDFGLTIEEAHAFPDEGAFTVTATVSAIMEETRTAVATRSITIEGGPNLTMDPLSFDPADPFEGEEVSVSFTFDDAADAGPYEVQVDWGDGSAPSAAGVTGVGPYQAQAAHTYATSGTVAYTVTAQVTAADGATAQQGAPLTVANWLPTIFSFAVTPDGFTASADLVFQDNGYDDPHVISIDWGDETDPETLERTEGPSEQWMHGAQGGHTYAAAGTYEVAVRVHDGDAGVETSEFVTVPSNPPPVPNLESSSELDPSAPAEGESAQLTVDFDDTADNGPYLLDVDWGDGSTSGPSAATPPECTTACAGSVGASHVYGDDGSYELTYTLTPATGEAATGGLPVAVTNVAPQVTLTAPVGEGPLGVQEGETLEVAGTFTDPGADDAPFTGRIDWVNLDAEGDVGTVLLDPLYDAGSGVGTFDGVVTPAGTGTYAVAVQVRDKDDAPTVEQFELEVSALTTGRSPSLSVTPAAGLARTGATVAAELIDVEPGTVVQLRQCRQAANLLACGADQGGAASPSGRLDRPEMAVEYATEHFRGCPVAECVVRAATVTQDSPWVNPRLNERPAANVLCAPGTFMDGFRADTELAGFGSRILNRVAPICAGEVGRFLGNPASADPDEDSSCPAGQVVVGLGGRHGDLVDQLSARCQAVVGGVLDGPVTSGPDTGGTGGSPFTAVLCPAGTAAIGMDAFLLGAYGDPIQSVRLVCASTASDWFDVRVPIAFTAPPADVTSVTVTATQPGVSGPGLVPEVLAGSRDVPIASIPLGMGDLGEHGLQRSPLHRVDLAATPLHRVPLHRVPLHRVPLHRVPLHRVGEDGQTTTVEQSDGMVFGDLPLDALPLDQFPLTTVPLRRQGGWAGLIAGSVLEARPLQTLTLSDVHQLDGPTTSAGTPTLLEVLPIEDVDMGSTPLRDLTLAGLLLGETRLSDIDLSEDGAPEFWCERLVGAACDSSGAVPDVPIAALEWLGLLSAASGVTSAPLHRVGVGGAPLHRVQVQDIPLHRVPLHRVPLHRVDLAVSPLHRVPLHRVPLHRVVIDGVMVEATPLHRVPLHRVPLHRVPFLLDCSGGYCENLGGKTLEDAADDGRINPGATLGLLGGNTPDGEPILPDDLLLGHLLYLISAAIAGGEAPEGLAITLNDVLLGLLEALDFPWEELPFGDMPVSRFAPFTGEPPLSYAVNFALEDVDGAVPATVEVTLPPGFTAGETGTLTTGGIDEPVDLAQSGDIVTASVLAHSGATVTLRFDARPGITLGTHRAVAAVDAGKDPLATPSSAPVTVLEHWEDGATDTPETAPEARGDTIYLSHIATPGDVDYFRIPVGEAGKRISVRLTNLDGDADLVMYQPAPSAAPLHRVGLDTLPLDDEGFGSAAARSELAPETLQDVPVQVSPLHRVSANRGTADEAVELTTGLADIGEEYVIQVSSYNGATSTKPYVLRVRMTDAPPPPVCDTGVPSYTAAGQPLNVSGADPDTLFVINEARMRAVHDGQAVTDMMTALGGLLQDPAVELDGAVLDVGAHSKVNLAYAAWDAAGAGCKPELANAVADAIAGEIADVRAQHPSIEHVVVVGGDDILPFTRVPDTTRLNQSTYADSVGDPNPISAAFATEHALSDDPYGDADPSLWLNRQLYVSEVGVGRLVETPADIAGQLALFQASKGYLDPESAVVAGYDFLTDGATAVKQRLVDQQMTVNSHQPPRDPAEPVADHFLTEDWSAADIKAALFGQSTPGIASVNAHYDHHRSLPADAHQSGDEDGLFSIGDVEAGRLDGRILFTMGCHAGLAVPDGYVGTQSDLAGDWAQTFGAEKAVFVGNTGYGYGDDTAVALSERLMALYAEHLDGTLTVGEALAAAKHAYVGSMGNYGSYDEKVVQQTVFYGLPMYRLGTPPTDADVQPMGMAAMSGSAPQTVNDPLTGLEVAPTGFAAGPGASGFDRFTDDDRGDYFAVEGEDPLVTHWRPIQPKKVIDVTVDGLEARGALITGLSSTDELDFDVVFARPAVGPAANEPEVEFGGVAFPARLSNLTRTGGPEGPKDNLVLMPGQFFSDLDSGETTGTQRRYTNMDALVYYGEEPAEELTPPSIDLADAVAADGQVTFAAQLTDDSGVKRAVVLFKDEDGTGVWRSVELSFVGPLGRWVGSAPATFNDATNPEIEWFIQAVDGLGNVAASTNKGRMYPATPPAPPAPPVGLPGPQAPQVVEGTRGDNGWYLGPVQLENPEGQTSSTTELTEDGVHAVTVRAPNGQVMTYYVKIDGTKPVPTVAAPEDDAVIARGADVAAEFDCGDATSGVAACTATVEPGAAGAQAAGSASVIEPGGALPTGEVGTYVLKLSATDVAGNTDTTQVTYTVQESEDRTPPEVTIVSPENGQAVAHGAELIADFDCSDTESGIAQGACTGEVTGPVPGPVSVATGDRLPTGLAGTYTLTVTGTDVAGNMATATRSYTVRRPYGDAVLRPPVDAPPVLNRAKAGSTIPVKWQIRYTDGAEESNSTLAPATIVTWTTIQCPSSAPVENTTTVTVSPDANRVLYETVGEQYKFEWKTDKNLAKTCQRLSIHVLQPDGTSRLMAEALFTFT